MIRKIALVVITILFVGCGSNNSQTSNSKTVSKEYSLDDEHFTKDGTLKKDIEISLESDNTPILHLKIPQNTKFIDEHGNVRTDSKIKLEANDLNETKIEISSKDGEKLIPNQEVEVGIKAPDDSKSGDKVEIDVPEDENKEKKRYRKVKLFIVSDDGFIYIKLSPDVFKSGNSISIKVLNIKREQNSVVSPNPTPLQTDTTTTPTPTQTSTQTPEPTQTTQPTQSPTPTPTATPIIYIPPTITQTADTTPPEITLKGDNPLILEYGSSYSEAGYSAIDDVDGDITEKVVVTDDINLSKLGEYEVLYSVKDSAGNEANATRAVRVVDTTPPIITLAGDKNITIKLKDSYIEAGYSAIDNYDGNITDKVSILNDINTTKVGKYKVVYSVVDSSGNKAEAIRDIEVFDPYPYIPKELNETIAIKFLNKATFGANQDSIEDIMEKGIEEWLDEQFNIPLTDNIYLSKMIDLSKVAEPDRNPYSMEEYLADNDIVFNKEYASFHSPRFRLTTWFDTALRADDQLRHKVAYALSQIIVESDFEPIFLRRGEALARYFDILQKDAFGSYETLLNDISFNSGMGLFLTYNGNKKEYINEANVTIYPDENYAREIMQLFSIGLNELNIDGTPKKDDKGNLIPTYTQEDVNELSKVFTGWDTKRSGAGDDNLWDSFGAVGFTRGDFTHPLEFSSEYHDFGEKKVLGETIPANLSGEDDIKKAVAIIMNNPNVAPYISKNLIMRLTKSNPSPEYVARVATVFKETRGDLKEVVKAIFLDEEIWGDIVNNRIVKFKEPLIAYTNFLRAFKASPLESWYFCGFGGPEDENASNCEIVSDSFLFNDTRKYLNQGAGLAPTVFNFYDNDFIPNDPNFKATNSVAPEIQIMSDTIFINFSNQINTNLYQWDRNYILNNFYPNYKDSDDDTRKHYDTIADYIKDAPARGYVPVYYVGADKMLLDTSDELCVMEMIIDGDCDGDFENLPDSGEDYDGDQKAIEALIAHLNKKLTGNLLTKEEEQTIYNSLKDVILFNKYNVQDDDHPEYTKIRTILTNAIYPAIRAIVTSSVFMTE